VVAPRQYGSRPGDASEADRLRRFVEAPVGLGLGVDLDLDWERQLRL
jgi:hypothetical protein